MRPLSAGLLFALVLNLLLVVPEWWMPYTRFPYPWLAAETLIIVGLMMVIPARAARWLSPPVALGVLVAVGLALSDLATGWALGRPMNLLIDVPLATSVEHLLRGAIGRPLAWLTLALAALGVVVLLVVLAWRLFRLVPPRGSVAVRVAGVCLLAAGLLLQHYRDQPPIGLAVDAPAIIRFNDQTERVIRTAHERAAFADALEKSPVSVEREMTRLADRDVILGFIESYGVTMLDDPRYRSTGEAALAQLGQSLDQAGLHVATGRFESPVQGGQSWLAHGTVLSGQWMSNQIRYDLFLNADQPSLIRDFDAAGYETVALMPAITDPWPAGAQWGYDRIDDHARIDYAGPPLNWVTMPDQYTWHYLESAIREDTAAPVFAEVALISSHAPWTPILPIIDWERIGDGAVFQRWADAGPPPGEVWSDGDRIRDHYQRAVDYALRTAGEWAARSLDDGVLILLGDHQPAPLITGDSSSRAVPVHIIASDPDLVGRFEAEGFRVGVMPPPDSSGTLADLRGRLLTVFESQ
ncbi:hypothetical protein [Spiribacter vilamensis]|uniref:Sulfatase n=1 Tax=Spiribacter vilamensis TaxID=531306 RepID=A0A4Q8CYS6_9GAMM|nr:hypothetical protein [Spiribacter vilamensis]RZU98156.1 hypothetical protein EV698_0396 [Spiribacter vilamensis]TVO60943.1 hypothetical protein FPL09_01950 [Spiribacter vilamensis]